MKTAHAYTFNYLAHFRMYFSLSLIVFCEWIFGLISKYCRWFKDCHFTVLKFLIPLFVLLVSLISMSQHINSEFEPSRRCKSHRVCPPPPRQLPVLLWHEDVFSIWSFVCSLRLIRPISFNCFLRCCKNTVFTDRLYHHHHHLELITSSLSYSCTPIYCSTFTCSPRHLIFSAAHCLAGANCGRPVQLRWEKLGKKKKNRGQSH